MSTRASYALVQPGPGGRLVGGELGLELVQTGELPLGAQVVLEARGHALTVEVAAEVEYVHLERRRLLRERRPGADVGHAPEAPARGVDGDRVDAEGQRLALAGDDVGSRVADGAATARAGDHLSAHRVRFAEQAVGSVEVARLQVGPYARRLHDLAAYGY